MIKLDRRRKRKKQDEEEEPERTEVNFAQDVASERLSGIECRGGLEIRRKTSGGDNDEEMEENEKTATRKGPAMPPPEVLAALANQEVKVDETTDVAPTPPTTTTKMETQEDKPTEVKAPFKTPEFKAPQTIAAPVEQPTEEPSCSPKGTLPSEIYKEQKPVEEDSKPEAPTLSYRPPAWSGPCPDDSYKLEVLKGGKIIGAYKLAEKATHVLGKLETCDLRLEHPSVSRYHCMLQWHVQDKTWKLLDYGSTHGLRINKMKLKPHQYVRCCVGSVIEIGLSTRKYIMVGPESDQLEETKESGFELREKFKKQKRKLEKKMLGESDSDSDGDEDKKKKKEEGVNWGFAEDAWDDDNDFGEIEATDKKPSFLKTTLNPDAFYQRDPLKAINHFFTSDAQEPPWQLTQTPKGRWECKLELPIGDGHNGVLVSGEADGKIGAKTVCALEACLALDRHGMFDEHAKARKKRNKLEENDFYDSDEDEFFDRTGELNIKREKRRQAAGLKNKQQEKALSHDECVAKANELRKELSDLERKMAKDKEMREATKKAEDPLDAFMKQVKQGKALDSITRSKMHREKAVLAKELAKYDKLAKLSAPAKLSEQLTTNADKKRAQQKLLNRMKTGKRTGFGLTKPIAAASTPKMTPTIKTDNNVIEHDSDEEDKQTPKVVKLFDKGEKNKQPTHEKAKQTKTPATPPKSTETEKPTKSELPKAKKSRVTPQATITPGMLKNEFKPEFAVKANDAESEKKARVLKKAMKNFDTNYAESEEYSTWVPPTNQSGDGTTDLNKKLGY